jgi:hypothetical protein
VASSARGVAGSTRGGSKSGGKKSGGSKKR